MELNERAIKAAAPGAILRDATVKGLHLRVTATKKSFYLYYRTKAGIERRPKLGDVGSITLTQARKMAQEMLAQVGMGKDPSHEVKLSRDVPDMAALWELFKERHVAKKKAKSQQEMTRLWNTQVAPRLGKKRVTDVTHLDIENLSRAMSATPVQANRTLALLSKMFSYAYRPLDIITENPCKGIEHYKETKRKRYMTAAEARDVFRLLEEARRDNPASVAFIYLLIFTGARSGEIASAKWEHLDGSVLRLPDSKTGARPIYLPKLALDVLEGLPRTSGTITGIKSPKKLWDRIRQEAHAPDLRIHDLRHSFASAALSSGFSLAQIGELLGHRSTQTTQRYAHLVEEHAAQAAETTANSIVARMTH